MNILSRGILPDENLGFFGPSRLARNWASGPAGGPAYGGGVEHGGWRNDHSFNSGAAVYGFWNFIIPEVAAEHPDWSPSQVHTEGLSRFNFRISEGMGYARKEQKGEDTIKIWRPEERNGEVMLVIHGGAYDGYTLEQLWGHTEDYAKDQGKQGVVDHQEYLAQKAFHKALLSGEVASTASIVGHPDSVKIFQSFLHGSDGLFYSHQIDLKKATGRTLTFSEGKTLMAKLYEKYAENASVSEARHDHFMLKKGQVVSSDVKMIAQAIVLTARPDVISAITSNVVGDAVATARSFYLFVEAKRGEVEYYKKIKNADTIPERNTLKKILQKPESFTKAIEIHSLKAKQTVLVAHFVRETRVGIGAVPFLIGVLAKELPVPLKAVEKSIARYKKKEAKKLKKEIMEMRERQNRRSRKTIAMVRRRSEEQIIRKSESNTKRKTKKQLQLLGEMPLRKKKKVGSELAKKVIKKTEKVTNRDFVKTRKEKTLFRVLVLWVKRWHPIREIGENKINRKVSKKTKELTQLPIIREQKRKQQEVTAGFSIAWIVWLLFDLLEKKKTHFKNSFVVENNKNSTTIGVDKPLVKPAITGEKEDTPEGLISKGPPEWILLTIIWYLAQQKEAGLFGLTATGQNLVLQQKNNKKKPLRKSFSIQAVLAQRGVIYAFI
ncbi:hypothetical protein HY086_04885 [Candidatus Gottesmanbacteria bacterium]|nr:hypothetical protein [Candidatus Gottesmanbacteria bacterium]